MWNNGKESEKKEKEKTKAISKLLQKLLQKKPTPQNTNRSRRFMDQSEANQFAKSKLNFNKNKKNIPGIDYDTIQFGENGLKFWVDYSNSKLKNKRVNSFLRDIAIKHAVARISSIVQLEKSTKFGPYNKRVFKKCSDHFIEVPSFYEQNSVGRLVVITDADFVLFVNIFEDDFQIHAGAMACVRKKKSKRPIAGTLVFNSFHAEPSLNTLDETVSTIIHEVFHAMFFERSILRRFPPNSEGLPIVRIDQKETFQLRSHNFIKFAREHFNCSWRLLTSGPTIKEIPLENDGKRSTKGSHLERILFGNELMIPETPIISILSKFTLSLLKDSGFYTVDLDQAEEFYWAKNAGCNFAAFFCNGEVDWGVNK